jgi:hypothetical protein
MNLDDQNEAHNPSFGNFHLTRGNNRIRWVDYLDAKGSRRNVRPLFDGGDWGKIRPIG